MDFEVYSVREVVGHGTAAEDEQTFLPFYALNDLTRHQRPPGVLHRPARAAGALRRGSAARDRARATWAARPSLALVDADEAPICTA